MWNLEKDKIVRQYSGHNPDAKITSTSKGFLRVRSLDFSPDGKKIVSSDVGAARINRVHALKVWSIEMGKDLITIAGEHQEGKSQHLAMIPKLREITLQSTPVTGEGLRHLATCKSLRNINCWSTGVTSEDIRRLKKVLSNCEVDKTLIE